MIQFEIKEFDKIMDELYEAVRHLEDVPEAEEAGAVNLLRAGMQSGQALQIVNRISDMFTEKLREAKMKQPSKDSFEQKYILKNETQPQVEDGSAYAAGLRIDQDFNLLAKRKSLGIKTSKAQPMRYTSSPWDDEQEDLCGSRD